MMYWFRKGAEGYGNPRCMYELGNCYINGTGVKQDFSEAKRWLKKVEAATDDAMLQGKVAWSLEKIDELIKDRERAEKMNKQGRKTEAASHSGGGIILPDLEEILPQIGGMVMIVAYYRFMRLYLALGGFLGGGHASLEVKGAA